jgi:hypothetical protein
VVAARSLLAVTSLLTLVETIIQDPAAKAAFVASPDAFLASHGFGDFDPVDVDDAVLHAADTLPPTLAAQIVGVDGLQAAAQVDLHDLGMGSLDDWSGLDHPSLHAETPAEATFDIHDPFHGDVDFDRPVTHQITDDATHDATHDGTSHDAGENSLTVVESHGGVVDHSGHDHSHLSHDEATFADASFDEAIADSYLEAHHEPSQHELHDRPLHDGLLHDGLLHDGDGDLGLGDDDDQPDDFEIG